MIIKSIGTFLEALQKQRSIYKNITIRRNFNSIWSLFMLIVEITCTMRKTVDFEIIKKKVTLRCVKTQKPHGDFNT